nr:binding partner of ACD11 1-like [Ipomoea batatas]
MDMHGNWDVELLNDIFDAPDIPRILRTPISPTQTDSWYWKGDVRGMDSVKQGCWLWDSMSVVRTVKVSNVSLSASEEDIMEFFSFSGEIEYVEMQSANERSETAYVTFMDPQGAETALLLSGSTIVDQSVTIELDPEYKLPPNVLPGSTATENQPVSAADSVILTAEDVVSSMLAKGFILGKDALNKAKDFDEKHQFTSTASATVASFDQKVGFTEKIGIGATIVNDKVKEMDQKLQVSEKTKSAFAVAEQSVSSAGSAIMKNRYILTGATWVTGAFSRVTKAAEEVGQKTKEKMVEEEQGRNAYASEGYAQINTSSESSKAPTTQESRKS